ncbi:phage integrase-related [Holotrichia oblita]|uniref:Phage integrase-related n=1 Tax=Holotrichia oblita TaxID=644536 RepID=A0ACB9TBK3_HOLOL|nr:phage integrase-related [Holotrichia oblita]
MKVADVDLREDIIVINIPHTKNKSCRKFVIVEPMWIDVVTRYLLIRPSSDIPRLFIGFRSGKPTRQNMGHNTISTSAIKVATYLKLPDANNYTGHSFRRTSATILADNRGDILSLKRHGGWKSSTVAEGYVEDSITDKKRIASMVQGTTVNYEPNLPPSTSIFEVTPSTSTSVSKSNTELNIPVENFTSNTGDKRLEKYKNYDTRQENDDLNTIYNLWLAFQGELDETEKRALLDSKNDKLRTEIVEMTDVEIFNTDVLNNTAVKLKDRELEQKQTLDILSENQNKDAGYLRYQLFYYYYRRKELNKIGERGMVRRGRLGEHKWRWFVAIYRKIEVDERDFGSNQVELDRNEIDADFKTYGRFLYIFPMFYFFDDDLRVW